MWPFQTKTDGSLEVFSRGVKTNKVQLLEICFISLLVSVLTFTKKNMMVVTMRIQWYYKQCGYWKKSMKTYFGKKHNIIFRNT